MRTLLDGIKQFGEVWRDFKGALDDELLGVIATPSGKGVKECLAEKTKIFSEFIGLPSSCMTDPDSIDDYYHFRHIPETRVKFEVLFASFEPSFYLVSFKKREQTPIFSECLVVEIHSTILDRFLSPEDYA